MTVEQILRVVEERLLGRFYGKYEAVVTATDDPLEIGRVRALVPAVLGEDTESGWALPCAPFGGGRERGMLFLPEVGDTVWIEFAAGDVSRPIWSGAFWGAPDSAGGQDDLAGEAGSEVPASEGRPAGPAHRVLQTTAGHRLVFDDDGEVVILAHGGGAEIRLTRSGEVVVKADKIRLGGDGANEPLVLGQAFQQLFNSHTHPTGVGPSGPPVQPLTPGQLSAKVTTE